MEDVVNVEEGIRLYDYLMSHEPDYEGNKSIPEEDADESIRRGDIEYVPTRSPREPPVIRDPSPGGREDPSRPSEPVDGLDWCGRCPPVARDPRPGLRVEPKYGDLGIIEDPPNDEVYE
jgi:hypothetical protein